MRKVLLATVILLMPLLGTGFAQITIDGDMLDWADVPRADVGNAEELLGDITTGPEFDLAGLYITSDDDFVYVKVDIDPSATFSNGFTNYTNPPVLELYFDVTLDDTTGLTWGWWTIPVDYQVSFGPFIDPNEPSNETTILHFTGATAASVWPDDWDSVGVAFGAVNDDDNSVEVAVPRSAINAGTNVRPFVYSVGDYIWDQDDHLPNDQKNDPAWIIDYSLVTKTASVIQTRGPQIVNEITIDGDLFDWDGIAAADQGMAAEELGDMPTGPSFDLMDMYMASDSNNLFVRLDIDPAGKFTDGFTNYTNPPVLELWFDTNMGDTTGLGWGGFWIQAGDYRIPLDVAFNPDGPTNEATIYHYGSDYGGSEEIYDSVGVAQVAINADDNVLEVSVPRSVINAGPRLRPFVYSVGDFLWDTEEYLPDDEINEEGPSYTIEYDFINGPSVVQVKPEPEPVAVHERSPQGIPRAYVLAQNYPNPFNPETLIRYEVPRAGLVTLAVYSLLGHRIATLFDGQRKTGRYQAVWNGTDDAGRKMASGVYFYRLRTSDGIVLTRKMLLVQ